MLEQHGPVHSLVQLSGSIIPEVLRRSEFWLMLGVHLMTWGGYQSGYLALQLTFSSLSRSGRTPKPGAVPGQQTPRLLPREELLDLCGEHRLG